MLGTSSNTRSVTGASLLVDSLIEQQVDCLFGLPGDTGVAFYDALYRRSADLRHVLARDERHAAAMADAYARVSGRVGVVEVSSGGGCTYVIGGLGEAYAASVPVLVITSDIHRRSHGTGALTEIDQVALFSAVTKRAFVVGRAAELPAIVAAALSCARSGRPGPVAVIIPEDVFDQLPDDQQPPDVGSETERPVVDTANVTAAAASLAAARRPALLVGGGIHFSQAYDQLAALAHRLGAPVATTIQGKGAIADDHPLAVGVTGNNGGNATAAAALQDADCVLIIGSRANATDTDSYTAPPRSAEMIIIDVDPSVPARNYPDARLLTGDAATVLDQLLAALPAAQTGTAWTATTRVPNATAPRPGQNSRLVAEDVIDALAEILADHDPIVVADPGAPTPAVADRWPIRHPGRSVVVPRGHGPMGYALPASVGVALAAPGRPVLALTADGSFAMCCGELETIARLALPIIAVQLTNNSLGWIKMLQHLYSDGRFFGVDPGPIDAVGVAAACGLNAERAENLDQLRDAVSRALQERRPTYIDVPVAHMIDAVPQVPAWHRALAGDSVRPVY